jgi:hypothetical protein
MKTEKLFKYYNSFLNENVEGGEPDATDVAEMPADAMAPDPSEMTSEGEKVIVELLVQAFLHEPPSDDAAIAKELQADIETDPKVVIAKIRNLLQMSEGDMKETLAQA